MIGTQEILTSTILIHLWTTGICYWLRYLFEIITWTQWQKWNKIKAWFYSWVNGNCYKTQPALRRLRPSISGLQVPRDKDQGPRTTLAEILVKVHITVIIIRSHCCTTYVDAAYYQPSRMVCQSVCRSSEPCKNGWTDRDAAWAEDLGGPTQPCIRWESRSFLGNGQFWGGKGRPIVKYRNTAVSCENGWTDPDAVSDSDLGGPKEALGGVHTGATWWIPLHLSCAAAMRPAVKLLQTLIIITNEYY